MSLVRLQSIVTIHPMARLIGGLGIGQIIGWGSTFYLPTILASDISRDIGLSQEAVYGGVTIMLLVSAALSPAVGRRLDKLGARGMMTAGCVVAGLSLILLAISWNFVSYVVAWVVMGFASATYLTNSSFVAVAQIAGTGARRAMTVLMLFTGSASSIAWPILSYLDGALGWRLTCLVLAVGQIGLCAPLHWWLLGIRPDLPAPQEGALVLADAMPVERHLVAMLILVPCMCLSGFISWGLSVQIVELLKRLGAQGDDAIWLASLLGVLQVSSRVIDLAMGTRHTPLLTGIIAAFLLTLAFAIAISGFPPGSPAAAFMIVYGIASGSMSLARVMIPLALFGPRSYGRISGVLSAFQNVAYAMAPLVYAMVFERAGTGTALWMSLAAGLSTLVGMSVLYRMRNA